MYAIRSYYVALEACKQCNRPKPPDLHEVTDYKTLLFLSENHNHDLKIIFWEDEKQNNLQETLAASGEIRNNFV